LEVLLRAERVPVLVAVRVEALLQTIAVVEAAEVVPPLQA